MDQLISIAVIATCIGIMAGITSTSGSTFSRINIITLAFVAAIAYAQPIEAPNVLTVYSTLLLIMCIIAITIRESTIGRIMRLCFANLMNITGLILIYLAIPSLDHILTCEMTIFECGSILFWLNTELDHIYDHGGITIV